MNNNSIKIVLLTSFSLFIAACGGGGSTTTNNQTTGTGSPSQNIQPTALKPENWQSARLIQTANPMTNKVDVVGSQLIIEVKSTDITEGHHLQLYLNTDAKPETGFQFDGEAWEGSGVDYIIEDGDLFKSTANNTGWSWNINVGAIDYTINSDKAVAKIDLSLLGDICKNIKVGIMTRNEFWGISTYSPASTQMQNFSVTYCNTNTPDKVKPIITLLGANPLKLVVNEVFTDPGATATDNVDGEITDRISPKSNVNTAVAGTYEISYHVTDIAGNSASITRKVIVSNIAPPEGIIIDGNTNDWSNIPTFSSSADGIMKVSDDKEKLYILVTSSNLGENTQILLDTDNKAVTGLALSAQVNAWVAGADYMIENNDLDKSKSKTGWSWEYGIAAIEYIRTSDVLEIAIKKSDFKKLANIIPMGYISRSTDWNVNYILPVESLPSYTLEFPVAVNPVIANNDTITTSSDQAVQIDVLANDSSSTNSALTVKLPSQPNTGNATVSQNKVIYTPDLTFTGTVTFAYELTDANGNKDTANIKVTVTETVDLNSNPVALDDSATTIGINTKQIAVLNNDTDADGDTLQVTTFNQPTNGSVTLTTATILNYTPNATFSGTDKFTYSISDGNGGTDNATVTVTVPANSPPDADEESADVDFDKTITVDVLANDTDIDNDVLTVVSIVQPSVGFAQLNTDGTIFVDPQNNVASLSIAYTVSDGRGGFDIAVLTIASTDPNDGNDAYPNITNEYVTTSKNTAIFIDVLTNDSDADGDVLVLDQVDQGEFGSTEKVTQNGVLGVLYTPTGVTGTDIFYYGVHDGHGHNGSGFVEVTITQ